MYADTVQAVGVLVPRSRPRRPRRGREGDGGHPLLEVAHANRPHSARSVMRGAGTAGETSSSVARAPTASTHSKAAQEVIDQGYLETYLDLTTSPPHWPPTGGPSA